MVGRGGSGAELTGGLPLMPLPYSMQTPQQGGLEGVRLDGRGGSLTTQIPVLPPLGVPLATGMPGSQSQQQQQYNPLPYEQQQQQQPHYIDHPTHHQHHQQAYVPVDQQQQQQEQHQQEEGQYQL